MNYNTLVRSVDLHGSTEIKIGYDVASLEIKTIEVTSDTDTLHPGVGHEQGANFEIEYQSGANSSQDVPANTFFMVDNSGYIEPTEDIKFYIH